MTTQAKVLICLFSNSSWWGQARVPLVLCMSLTWALLQQVGDHGEPLGRERLQLQGDDGQGQRGALELPKLVAGHTVLHLPGPQRRLEDRGPLLMAGPAGGRAGEPARWTEWGGGGRRRAGRGTGDRDGRGEEEEQDQNVSITMSSPSHLFIHINVKPPPPPPRAFNVQPEGERTARHPPLHSHPPQDTCLCLWFSLLCSSVHHCFNT